MKIVITGGAGFIGSHLAEYCYYLKPSELVIVDNMGYAANYDNISHIINDDIVKFVLADITNYAIYKDFLQDTDVLIHTAAESHVDNSFFDPLRFVKSNVEGTQVLLHACKEYSVKKIIHFSTDEVYGDKLEGTFYEGSVLNPTNPYSASKAAAEMMVKSYIKSFNLPIIVVRPNNTYGIRQHWEKLIPTCCMHLKKGKKIPIHGDGIAIRDYLSVKDLCRAIDIIIERAENVLAMHSPKAVMGLVDAMDEDGLTPAANIRIKAAKQILDRVGIVKKEKIDINAKVAHGIFILPPKDVQA